MKTGKCLSWCVAVIAFGSIYACVAYEERGQPSQRADRAPEYKSRSGQVMMPVTVSQCTKINGNSIFIQRGTDSCIETLKSFDNSNCTGEGEVVEKEKTFDKTLIFTGSLTGNQICSENITIKESSPCQLVEIISDNYPPYKLCYHDNKKISLSNCLNHTGVCGPPHNP